MTAQTHHHPGHDAVGAYALGVLDEADATHVEEHLAGCAQCGRRLDELTGLEPLLADLAAGVPGIHGTPGRTQLGGHTPHAFSATPHAIETLTARPGPALLHRMLGEVAASRAKRRRRGLYLVAAAAALIIGGPLGTIAVTSGSGSSGADSSVSAGAAESTLFAGMPDKVRGTDPDTKVDAAVALEDRLWGTDAVLRLKNVKGPLDCSLIAISKDGQEQTMTTWSVPAWGYGIEDSPRAVAREPLWAHGGAALQRADIDRFEVRTSEGKRLISLDV
ncbi:RNA polymerase subunit sigma [Streptomyces hygroscopicus subsp. sporocinereus]|uniref:RNA polymerase subunit sigma n=1 Tax=Streptomyces hygroscopicus TaxID=1912 RepID=A0ABQ3TV59_STRHY|nr:zf-HC2 domain-containing protein [Streptomyces hygroscopicus]GHJ27224.1 RNA polymerase subunit sigma [Streptomyces hygroscopicus]